jgi:hypothetical protein
MDRSALDLSSRLEVGTVASTGEDSAERRRTEPVKDEPHERLTRGLQVGVLASRVTYYVVRTAMVLWRWFH